MDRFWTYNLTMQIPEGATGRFIAARLRTAAAQVERVSRIERARAMHCHGPALNKTFLLPPVEHGVDHDTPETNQERQDRIVSARFHTG